MNNKYQLGLRYGQIYEIYQNIKDIFYDLYGAHLDSRQDMDLNSGISYLKDKQAYVGEKGLIGFHISKNNARVTDKAAVLYITSMFHELQHFHQHAYEYQGKDNSINQYHPDASMLMTIQNFATLDNELYYQQHYSYNLSELNAEEQGFAAAFTYLQELFPDKQEILEEVFVSVFNEKASAVRHWLHPEYQRKPFQNIADIEKAFQDATVRLCERSYMYEHGEYPSVTTDALMTQKNTKVYYNATMQKVYDLSNKDSGWLNIYCDVIGTRGITADRKLASLVCYFFPQEKDKYALLNDVDLSMETNFGFCPKDYRQILATQQVSHTAALLPHERLNNISAQIAQVQQDIILQKNTQQRM